MDKRAEWGKPADVSQDDWSKAYEVWESQSRWEGDRIVVDNVTPIARAISQARAQAYEDAAQLAFNRTKTYGFSGLEALKAYMQGREDAANAIRQHSQRIPRHPNT